MSHAPYFPTPAAEIPADVARTLYIRPLFLVFHTHGADRFIETTSSAVAFAALRTIAADKGRVIALRQAGLYAKPASLAALNSFLRAALVFSPPRLPYDRVLEKRTDRYAWAALCDHLDLEFVAP